MCILVLFKCDPKISPGSWQKSPCPPQLNEHAIRKVFLEWEVLRNPTIGLLCECLTAISAECERGEVLLFESLTLN